MESKEGADIAGVIPTDETTSLQEEVMDVLTNNQDSPDEREPPTSSPTETEQPTESTQPAATQDSDAREDTQITGVTTGKENIDDNKVANEEMIADNE
eukprot:4793168-Ditylum_brightwellii.AAC.1